MRKLCVCVLATATTLGVLAAPAVAGDTRCVGGLPPGVYDNVVVPRGADCNAFGVTVQGNFKVLRGASLFSQFNQIHGNLEGDRPRFVGSLGDVIGGNFQVTGATGSPGFLFNNFSLNVFLCGSTLPGGNAVVKESVNGTVAVGSLIAACPGNRVNGNIQVEDNFIPVNEALAVARNTVGGNIQVVKNRGQGMKTVAENVVGQNIQCKENEQPFVGGPNFAGEAEGQCFVGGP